MFSWRSKKIFWILHLSRAVTTNYNANHIMGKPYLGHVQFDFENPQALNIVSENCNLLPEYTAGGGSVRCTSE